MRCRTASFRITVAAIDHSKCAVPDFCIEETLETVKEGVSPSLCKKCKMLTSAAFQVLWSPALSYYVQSRARHLGFTQLFIELKRHIAFPQSRWAFCLRSKRGLRNTAQCGGLAKDRVYFEGAIKILTCRWRIDFRVMHSGKVCCASINRPHDQIARSNRATKASNQIEHWNRTMKSHNEIAK